MLLEIGRERGRERARERERERALNSFNLQREPDRDDREGRGDRETQRGAMER